MPVRPTYPGVYIEEVPSGVRTITGVATSIGAFLGTFRKGLLNEAAGKNDTALDFYLKAVNGIEGDRRALRDDRTRGTVLEGRMGYYYAAVRLLLAHKRYADAFQMFERSRSRSLSMRLRRPSPSPSRSPSRAETRSS